MNNKIEGLNLQQFKEQCQREQWPAYLCVGYDSDSGKTSTYYGKTAYVVGYCSVLNPERYFIIGSGKRLNTVELLARDNHDDYLSKPTHC